MAGLGPHVQRTVLFTQELYNRIERFQEESQKHNAANEWPSFNKTVRYLCALALNEIERRGVDVTDLDEPAENGAP